MKKLLAVLATSVFCISNAAAQSSPISYNYIGFTYQEMESGGTDFIARKFDGSYSFNNSVFFTFGYLDGRSDNQIDFGAAGFDYIDTRGFDVGAGYRVAVHEWIDAVAAAEYTTFSTKHPGVSQRDDGYTLSAGVRTNPIGNLELSAFYKHVDVEGQNDSGHSLSAHYRLLHNLSIGAEFSDIGNTETTGITIRFNL